MLMALTPLLSNSVRCPRFTPGCEKSMGEHRTGDLKRIEKICQRIGLHFRKPGRPKMAK